jgi:hypothetical protein
MTGGKRKVVNFDHTFEHRFAYAPLELPNLKLFQCIVSIPIEREGCN